MLVTRKLSIVRETVRPGIMAAIGSLIPVLALGRKNTGHWTPGANAVSHWLWGEPSLKKVGFSLQHTMIGMGTHFLASLVWSRLFCWICKNNARHTGRNAALVSALACLIDYKFTPKRFTPGYEHHLSRKDLFIVHVCLAAGLALSSRK